MRHVLLENFLEPYLFNGQKTESGMKVVSLYVDQFPKGEMAREVARTYGITIYPTIAEALRAGSDRLAVDAVLSIGEHGSYATNAKAQIEYPRKRFFDEIVAEFRRSRATVPVFSDKHLSYRAEWATEMVETARKMGFPFMAGSSVPLAARRPPLELPAGAKITEAVSIHGGGLETYDFHGLEVLQAMVESRAGGETGIKSVEFLDGDRLWRAADEGRWSPDLADAARATDPDPQGPGPLREVVKAGGYKQKVHGILITYKDGLRGTVLNAARDGTHWHFACKLAGDPTPKATSFYVGPWENRCLFKALAHAIQSTVPGPQDSVSGRADAADDLCPGRGHGVSVTRPEAGDHALPRCGLSARGFPGDERDGKIVERSVPRYAPAQRHRHHDAGPVSRAVPSGLVDLDPGPERVVVDIPAADHDHDIAIPGQVRLAADQGRDGDRAGGLGS